MLSKGDPLDFNEPGLEAKLPFPLLFGWGLDFGLGLGLGHLGLSILSVDDICPPFHVLKSLRPPLYRQLKPKKILVTALSFLFLVTVLG